MHGTERWYRHNYSSDELRIWADRIKASGATRAWIYFNNDNDAFAIGNAKTLRLLLQEQQRVQRKPGRMKRAVAMPESKTASEVT